MILSLLMFFGLVVLSVVVAGKLHLLSCDCATGKI